MSPAEQLKNIIIAPLNCVRAVKIGMPVVHERPASTFNLAKEADRNEVLSLK